MGDYRLFVSALVRWPIYGSSSEKRDRTVHTTMSRRNSMSCISLLWQQKRILSLKRYTPNSSKWGTDSRKWGTGSRKWGMGSNNHMPTLGSSGQCSILHNSNNQWYILAKLRHKCPLLHQPPCQQTQLRPHHRPPHRYWPQPQTHHHRPQRPRLRQPILRLLQFQKGTGQERSSN